MTPILDLIHYSRAVQRIEKNSGLVKNSLGFFCNFIWKSLNVSPTQYFTYWISSLLQKDITQEQG